MGREQQMQQRTSNSGTKEDKIITGEEAHKKIKLIREIKI